ncbi:MAG: DUF4835 family protein [Bacteroidota bacterium]
MKKYIVMLFLGVLASTVYGQELNATVMVNAPTITGIDKHVFETLKTAIQEFYNNRKWTEDAFLNQERIECTININLQTMPSTGIFQGTCQVQSRRPIFGTSYNSPMVNFYDENFNFTYQENTPLDFNDQTDLSNLTSMLAYYAYVVIGMDYDSYSLNGGGAYLQKAQNIINFCQSEAEKGWKAFENTKNRYWFMDNLLDQQFKGVREASYKYHRKGLDIMSEKPDEGRKIITDCEELVYNAFKNKPGAYLFKIYFDTKADELVNIFTQGQPDEKTKVVAYFNEMDPANGNKYQKITAGK